MSDTDSENGPCEEHPKCIDANEECVNCGNECCAACVAGGSGMTRCDGCGDYVCDAGDCCKDRGEGPDGATKCTICGNYFCAECLRTVDSHEGDDTSMWCCKYCVVTCSECKRACRRCFDQAYCCECECPLVGEEDET